MEQENQRLEEEIIRMQLARGRRHDNEGWRVLTYKRRGPLLSAVRNELKITGAVRVPRGLIVLPP